MHEWPDEWSLILTMRLFPADGVAWMVTVPSAIAAETAWPDMEWVEALSPQNVGSEEARRGITHGPGCGARL